MLELPHTHRCGYSRRGILYYDVANRWEVTDPQVYSDDDIFNARIVSYVLFGIGGLFFCLMIYLRKSIQVRVKQHQKRISA